MGLRPPVRLFTKDMTDKEFNTELVKRLREHFRYAPGDCTDAELIEHTKNTLSYAMIGLSIRFEELERVIKKELKRVIKKCSTWNKR